MNRIIDCHTHAGVDWFWRGAGFKPNSQTVRALLAKMDSEGVWASIVFPMPSCLYFAGESGRKGAGRHSLAEQFPYERANQELLDEVASLDCEGRNRILPFLCFGPVRDEGQQLHFLENRLKSGQAWGLKYHPYACREHLWSERNRSILEFADSQALPVMVHYGLDEFSGGPGIIELAKRYSCARFCVAHMARFDEAVLGSIHSVDNVYVDVSCLSGECAMATAFDLTSCYKGYRQRAYDYGAPEKVLARLISEFEDRLLWGTDEPFTHLRNREKVFYNSSFQEELMILRLLDDDDLCQIAYSNPCSFLGDVAGI